MTRARAITGAGVNCYINGGLVGRVSNFTFTSSEPKKQIRGIDSSQSYELAPTVTAVTATVGLFRTIGDGGSEGLGVNAFFPDVVIEKYFNIVLIERGSDLVLFQALNCSLDTQSWTVPTRGVVTGSITFNAIEWTNELAKLK